MAETPDALEILDRMVGDDPELRRLIEEATLNAECARMIHDLRAAAGLTHKQLAERVGLREADVVDLEDGEYAGNALGALRRIATALNTKVHVTPHAERRS